MTTVTLRWKDPEDAAEFLALRRDLRDQSWVTDAAAEALRELIGKSEVVEPQEEGTDG